MTYRELYAISHGEEAAKTAHIGNCPDKIDNFLRDPHSFTCPGCKSCDFDPGVYGCDMCWDSTVPAKHLPEQQEKPAEPDAEIRATVTGEDIHIHIQGDAANVMQAAIAIIHTAAEKIYADGKDWKAAEKLIHLMQEALKPTSKIWDFSEGGGGDDRD